MVNLNSIVKIIAVLSLIGFLLAIGLHEYHYSFDPYSWLDPNFETVESRNFWNERKWHYRYFGILSFAVLLLSVTTLFFNWLINRRTKLK
jgi:hypothetical protein